nr:hypothetical protein [Methylobacterium sp. Leaf122]
MPLIDFWKTNPGVVDQLSIAQIVSTAGDGNLRDNSPCSKEIREYFRGAASSKLSEYVEQCLSSKLEKGGMILQDLINELGRRLDYIVTNGRYQGVSGEVGFDGLWAAPEGGSVIVEVKTSDAYRVSLDTIIGYRARSISQKLSPAETSVLIVVGRQDTGELEAQVRGSRHAWDIRLISAESLIKLVILKENSADPDTDLKIRSILAPLEYTRLDRLVDVMFTAARDSSSIKDEIAITDEEEGALSGPSVQASTGEVKEKVTGIWDFTEPRLLTAQRARIISTISEILNANLIKQSRALFWDKDHKIRVVCTISKAHTRRPSHPYWYAHHPKWDVFLEGGESGFLVLGCMDLEWAFSIPIVEFHKVVDDLNVTENEKVKYWHIHITRDAGGMYSIVVPKSQKNFDLEPFKFKLLGN